MKVRDTYTGRGIHAFVSWNDSQYKYTENQLYLGYNPLSNIEIVSMLNINNLSRYSLHYASNRTKKYNPKIFMPHLNSASDGFLNDPTISKPVSWPES